MPSVTNKTKNDNSAVAGEERIPLSRPWLGELEAEAVRKVLLSGWLIQGPVTNQFEKETAEYLSAKRAVAVASGTAALHLALIAMGTGPGDEVIIPSHSFVATANSVVYVGATPVYVDIDPRTYNMDPDLLKKAITAKTRAVCVVHQSGLPADMDRILEITQEHSIPVYEDAACALGSAYRNTLIGSRSSLCCFSFHPRKVITTGEGGMITTDSPELARKLEILRQQGMTTDAANRNEPDAPLRTGFPVIGFNYRMTDISAAIGLAQLRRLPVMLESRRHLAEIFSQETASIPHIITPFVPNGVIHNYQSYVVRIKPSSKRTRDQVLRFLKERKIDAASGISCIHRQAPYKRFIRTPLPNSEEATDQTVLLPFFPQMTEEQVLFVARTLAQAVTGKD